MKESKRLSIFLASLAIAVSGSLPVAAVDSVILSDETGAREQLSLNKNDVSAYLTLDSIRYKDGEARGTVVAPTDDEWYIKTIVVAYMNFGQGVTEEEADQNLSHLTGAKDDAWVILSKYQNLTSYAGKTKNISMNQSGNLINVYSNKSDILYYAVEFGKITDDKQWDEVWWSRGKIDYRSCVHASVFDEATMTCKRLEDDNGAYYVPQIGTQGELVFPPENEEVLSWEDEWVDVISRGYEEIQKEIDLMAKYAESGVSILDQNDLALDGLMKGALLFNSAPTITWLPESIISRKAKIAELKEFYGRTASSDSSELEILLQENENLKAEKAELEQAKGELEAENTSLKQSNEELQSEKEALEREILKLKAEKVTLELTNENLEQENIGLRTENEALKGENAEVKAENAEVKAENAVLVEENTGVKTERDNLKLEKDKADGLNLELTEQLKEAQDMIQALQATDKDDNSEKPQDTVQDEAQNENSNENGAGKVTEGQFPTMVETVPEVNKVIEAEEKVTDGQNIVDADGGLAGETEKSQAYLEAQDVEIPTLGGEEVKTNGLWWILIPLVGLAGVTILVLKRKFSRR